MNGNDLQYTLSGFIVTGTYHALTLAIFAVMYFCLATWTYGLQVPSGLFIPLLLTGAAWGRLVGIGLGYAFADQKSWLPIYPGKYALIGAAAMLGKLLQVVHGSHKSFNSGFVLVTSNDYCFICSRLRAGFWYHGLNC